MSECEFCLKYLTAKICKLWDLQITENWLLSDLNFIGYNNRQFSLAMSRKQIWRFLITNHVKDDQEEKTG